MCQEDAPERPASVSLTSPSVACQTQCNSRQFLLSRAQGTVDYLLLLLLLLTATNSFARPLLQLFLPISHSHPVPSLLPLSGSKVLLGPEQRSLLSCSPPSSRTSHRARASKKKLPPTMLTWLGNPTASNRSSVDEARGAEDDDTLVVEPDQGNG